MKRKKSEKSKALIKSECCSEGDSNVILSKGSKCHPLRYHSALHVWDSVIFKFELEWKILFPP